MAVLVCIHLSAVTLAHVIKRTRDMCSEVRPNDWQMRVIESSIIPFFAAGTTARLSDHPQKSAYESVGN